MLLHVLIYIYVCQVGTCRASDPVIVCIYLCVRWELIVPPTPVVVCIYMCVRCQNVLIRPTGRTPSIIHSHYLGRNQKKQN